MSLIGLILILLAVAFLLRIDFIYYIVYVCIGILLISRIVIPRIVGQLRATRRFNDHAFIGENVDVILQITNQSHIPLPWLEVRESTPAELRRGQSASWAIGLGGKQQRVFCYQVQAGRRGYYKIGPTRMTSGDLYGLISPTTGHLEADYLTIYPRIIPLVELGLPSRLPFGTIASHQRLFEDPARPAGVRDYRSGDSQRQINWKASAHADQLLVRRLQPAISLETAILLNLHSGDYDRRNWRYYTEWAIVVAASLATHLANLRQPVGLITNGIDPLQQSSGNTPQFDEESGRMLHAATGSALVHGHLPPALLPHTSRAHLMKILEMMARVESDESISLKQWASTACSPLSWGVTIMAITANGDEPTCQALHRLVRAGFNPILIAVEPTHEFGETRERSRRLGFRAYHVLPEAKLNLWRQEKSPENT